MSRKDLTRRAASVLAASDDDDLKAVAQTVFAQFTPATPRQTYGGAELAVAGAALLMQMADLAYTAWSAGRASRGDASPDPLPPPANDQKTSSAEGGGSESGSALTNANICSHACVDWFAGGVAKERTWCSGAGRCCGRGEW